MAINSNFDIFHPTVLASFLLENQYAARPMIAMSATAPVGQSIQRLISNGGKTVNVNKPTKPGQSAVKAYSGTYTPDNPDGTQETLTINQHDYVNFTIDKSDARLSPVELVNNYVRPFYEELLDKVDTNIKGEAAKFNAAFTDLNGSNATVLDNEDITEAKRMLKERQFVKNNLVAVIDAGAEKDLTDLALFHQANTGADGATLQRNGMLGRKFGFDIFVDDNGHTQAASTIAGGTPTTDAAGSVDDTSIGADNAAGGALSTAATEGDVMYFTGAAGTDQFYVTNATPTGGDALNNLYLKEGLRDAVTDNTAILSTSGTSQFFFRRGALSLVTLGMQSVSRNSPGVERAVVFDPVNRINFTMTITETKSGGDVLMEALYGYELFYPEWGVRYIRGATAKA